MDSLKRGGVPPPEEGKGGVWPPPPPLHMGGTHNHSKEGKKTKAAQSASEKKISQYKLTGGAGGGGVRLLTNRKIWLETTCWHIPIQPLKSPFSNGGQWGEEWRDRRGGRKNMLAGSQSAAGLEPIPSGNRVLVTFSKTSSLQTRSCDAVVAWKLRSRQIEKQNNHWIST